MRLRWLALAVGPVIAAGCFSSNDSGPKSDAGTPEPDAAPTVDATTPLPEAAPEAAADTYVAEASLPDVRPEAEAGPPVVTVVVHSALGPEQGVAVVFQDATGNVLATATTDANGLAAQPVPAGSQATAVMGTPVAPRLTTLQGVAPGDVLSVYDASFDQPGANVSIDSLPDAAPPPGTASVYAQIGTCFDYSIPGSFALTTNYDCQSEGQFPVITYAQGGADAGNAVLGYTYQKGNTIPADGGTAHVALSGDWSTALGTQALTVDAPDAGPAVTISPLYILDEVANGVGFPDYNSNVWTDGGVNTYFFPTHPGYADSMQTEATVSLSGSTYATLATTGIATRGLGDSGTSSVDMNQLLPLIDSASIDSSNPAQPRVAWSSEAGSLTSVDGVVVALSWNDVTDAGAPVHGWWTIVAPATSAGVAAPALPAGASSWAPATTASFVSTPIVMAIEADFIADYAQLRAQAGSLPISSGLVYGHSTGVVPPLPADGTLRFSAYTINGD